MGLWGRVMRCWLFIVHPDMPSATHLRMFEADESIGGLQ